MNPAHTGSLYVFKFCSDIILPPSSKCHRVSQSFLPFKVPHYKFVCMFMYVCLQLPVVLDVSLRILRDQECDLRSCLLRSFVQYVVIYPPAHVESIFIFYN